MELLISPNVHRNETYWLASNSHLLNLFVPLTLGLLASNTNANIFDQMYWCLTKH